MIGDFHCHEPIIVILGYQRKKGARKGNLKRIIDIFTDKKKKLKQKQTLIKMTWR